MRTKQLQKGRKRDLRRLSRAGKGSRLWQKWRVRDLTLVRSYCRLSGEWILPSCLLAECPNAFEVLYKLYNNQEECNLLVWEAFTLV